MCSAWQITSCIGLLYRKIYWWLLNHRGYKHFLFLFFSTALMAARPTDNNMTELHRVQNLILETTQPFQPTSFKWSACQQKLHPNQESWSRYQNCLSFPRKAVVFPNWISPHFLLWTCIYQIIFKPVFEYFLNNLQKGRSFCWNQWVWALHINVGRETLMS